MGLGVGCRWTAQNEQRKSTESDLIVFCLIMNRLLIMNINELPVLKR